MKSIRFRKHLARTILASLVCQDLDSLRRRASGSHIDRRSTITKKQAQVLLGWHKRIGHSYATSTSLDVGPKALDQLLCAAAAHVVGWDRTIDMESAWRIQLGESEDTTTSQLAQFTWLANAPAYEPTDRHPDEVNAELEVFSERLWLLWLLQDMEKDQAQLDGIARSIAANSCAEEASQRVMRTASGREGVRRDLQLERQVAEAAFGEAMARLAAFPAPPGVIECLSDLVVRSAAYAQQVDSPLTSPPHMESLVARTCYTSDGLAVHPPHPSDVGRLYSRLGSKNDTWARDIAAAVSREARSHRFEAAQLISLKGLVPVRGESDVVVSTEIPKWLVGKPYVDVLLSPNPPPGQRMWLTTTVVSSDLRMAAELANLRFRSVLDAVACLHREPVAARTSGVVVHDPVRKALLPPGFSGGARPEASVQMTSEMLRECMEAISAMSRDSRPWVRSLRRGIGIWRRALQTDDLERRFVELWRAFEAIVGKFGSVRAFACTDFHPILLARATVCGREEIDARYAVVFRLRNHWAIHTADERPDVGIEFVPEFQLKSVCRWLARDVWILLTYATELALAFPLAEERADAIKCLVERDAKEEATGRQGHGCGDRR